MKRKIEFTDGIIEGHRVRDMIKVFPTLESSFTQRKQYDEYYFEPTEVEVSIENLDTLTDKLHFGLKISYDSIIID